MADDESIPEYPHDPAKRLCLQAPLILNQYQDMIKRASLEVAEGVLLKIKNEEGRGALNSDQALDVATCAFEYISARVLRDALKQKRGDHIRDVVETKLRLPLKEDEEIMAALHQKLQQQPAELLNIAEGHYSKSRENLIAKLRQALPENNEMATDVLMQKIDAVINRHAKIAFGRGYAA